MRRVTVLIAIAAATLAAAVPARATFSGTNGRIALSSWFLLDPPGTRFAWFLLEGVSGEGLFVSTGAVERPRNMAWSRDGLKVAYDGPATSLGSQQALYIQNGDGTGQRQVGRGDLKRYNPAWSPDGTKLAFVQDNGSSGSGDIYTITTSGGSLTRLTTSSGWDGEPDWSPDGTRIAYTCVSGGRRQICQMTPSGASKTVTTGSLGLGSASTPSWSPNSASIAFAALDSSGRRAIYRMSRTGGSLRMLRPGDVNVGPYGPAWSPDGTKLAVGESAPSADAQWGITTMSAVDGSNRAWSEIGSEDGDIPFDPSGWQAIH